jgi:hypothetical protein
VTGSFFAAAEAKHFLSDGIAPPIN